MLFVKGPKKQDPVVSDLIGVPDEEYKALAEKLGFNAEMKVQDRTPLARFLKENLIQVYRFSSVDRYMKKLAGKTGSQWRYCWRPARNADYPHRSFTSVRNEKGDWVSVNCNPSLYDKPIPFAALKTMETINDALGREVAFFVTDYEVKPVEWPDPFLAVMHLKSGEFYVIEKWDEPAYREEE